MFSSPHEQMHPFGMPRPITVDRRWKPNVEIAPNCPRCDSSNTKFCYYNNYSLTQPRYFCKGCRRYWTKGGSLRNVPVGGGSRKNRRGKSVRLSSRAADNCKSSSGALRPDLALDDMVGSSHQSMVSPSESSGGEAIDLAVLYSKFLNQSPEAEQEEGRFVPELAELVGLTSSEQLVGISEGDMAMIGDMSYSFDDASAFESVLAIPAPAEEVFESLAWQAPELPQGFCPFPEVHMGHHHNHWSSLDQSSFGAF